MGLFFNDKTTVLSKNLVNNKRSCVFMICEHSKYECPYIDCNYHINSSGKFRYSQDDMPDYLPTTDEEAENCDRNLDI